MSKEKTQAVQHKLDPKLRMVANGGEVVNTLRAERAANLAMLKGPALLRQVPRLRGARDRPVRRDELPRRARRGHLKEVPGSVFANVFIQLAQPLDTLPSSVLAGAVNVRTALGGPPLHTCHS